MSGRGRGRLIIGLMSGTSHDGVDAVLARVAGSGPATRLTLLGHTSRPYPPQLRKSISRAFEGSAAEICALNFRLGEVFAQAALRCALAAGVDMHRVDAVASHGQTICHIPPSGGRRGSTLQIGEPAVIAQRTGVPVVSDFRAADMAAGGEGAPLVPFADYVLFRKRAFCAVQNIGGMANVTVVAPDLEGVYAFDTGPGNSLMDEAALMFFKKPFDRGGALAKKGAPDRGLLKKLLAHPYFRKPPPKSTGRELFGKAMLERIVRRHKLKAEDLMATLAHFTAASIRDAYRRFVLPRHELREAVFSGGGTKNGFLMGLLREYLHPLPVRDIEEFGIPSVAKEALSFTVLANETLGGRPSNLPGATGAERPVRLGKITYP
jgi:anhydro-N-acetylmuramic acid kinase